MGYLEKGKLPWKQKNWPLSQPDIGFSETDKGREYPMIMELISIAVFEKDPEKVYSGMIGVFPIGAGGSGSIQTELLMQ